MQPTLNGIKRTFDLRTNIFIRHLTSVEGVYNSLAASQAGTQDGLAPLTAIITSREDALKAQFSTLEASHEAIATIQRQILSAIAGSDRATQARLTALEARNEELLASQAAARVFQQECLNTTQKTMRQDCYRLGQSFGGVWIIVARMHDKLDNIFALQQQWTAHMGGESQRDQGREMPARDFRFLMCLSWMPLICQVQATAMHLPKWMPRPNML